MSLLRQLFFWSVASLPWTISTPIHAMSITPTNFDDLNLGAPIISPLGPDVETYFADPVYRIGDLISSVSCPAGIDPCEPTNNPEGTIYTYQYQVRPGVDLLPNDGVSFTSPSAPLSSLENVSIFEFLSSAEGFNGVAGYSFSQAAVALNTGTTIEVEQQFGGFFDGRLTWTLSPNSGWDTDELITFFWQTTQPPSNFAAGTAFLLGETPPDIVSNSGVAQVPLPIPIPVPFDL